MVTAAAISEAQNDILAKFYRSVFYSSGIVWQMLSKILTLLLILRWIRRVVIKSSNAGCVDEKLNVLTPHQLLLAAEGDSLVCESRDYAGRPAHPAGEHEEAVHQDGAADAEPEVQGEHRVTDR